MITEDYVSFETAKLLKEKGFDVFTPCRYAGEGGITEKWYDDYRERVIRIGYEEGYLIEPPMEPKDQYEIIGNTISAPTLQMAMKWLRKEHKLCIVSIPVVTDDNGDGGCLWNYVISRKLNTLYKSESLYESQETALNDAIKYCLEHLAITLPI